MIAAETSTIADDLPILFILLAIWGLVLFMAWRMDRHNGEDSE